MTYLTFKNGSTPRIPMPANQRTVKKNEKAYPTRQAPEVAPPAEKAPPALGHRLEQKEMTGPIGRAFNSWSVGPDFSLLK